MRGNHRTETGEFPPSAQPKQSSPKPRQGHVGLPVDLGRCIVLEIGPDKLNHYRAGAKKLGVPLEREDQFIYAVGNLLQAFIDKAFGVDPVQLATQIGLSDSFQTAASHANLGDRQDATRVDLDQEGAITKTESDKDVRHDETTDRQGSHLLPRI